MFVEDTAFQPPPECRSHAEYATIFFNGQYYMYFRSFRNADGSYGDITGIGLATSSDGNTWTAHNGGRPVFPNRTYTNGSGTHSVVLFAPSVLLEMPGGNPLLTMVYEVMDTGVNGPSGLPRNWVEGATSTDGLTWTPIMDGANPRKIVVSSTAWEGFTGGLHRGNAGTPSINKFGSTYYIFYHGFSGFDGANCLKRGFASGSSMSTLTKYAGNPVLQPPGAWANAGIGKGDIVLEDGYYYQVHEGLKNSAVCGLALTGWGLARSTDLTNWQYSPQNPVRIDRSSMGCGEDMPSFQVIGANTYVLTTTSDLAEIPAVRRYKIVPTPRPVTTSKIVAMTGTPSGAGYWQLALDGKVFAFGDATALGDVTLPSGALPVDIAATPSGQGYWVALSNGGIRAFGNAGSFGSSEGQPLAQPMVGMFPTANGNGYWLYAADGGVFTFGNAGFHGSLGGNPPASPVVSMAARPAGDGYWMLSANGTTYSFGAAGAHGSMTGESSPAVKLLAGGSGTGYWIVARNGSIQTFGTGMPFFGSAGGGAPSNIVGGSVCRLGGSVSGYWLAAEDAGVTEFGAAYYYGDPLFTTVPARIEDWKSFN